MRLRVPAGRIFIHFGAQLRKANLSSAFASRSAFCFLLAAQKVCIPFQCGLRHESHLLLPMLCSALWCYRVPITHYRPLLPAPRFNVTHACGGKVLRTHPYLQACKYGCAQVRELFGQQFPELQVRMEGRRFQQYSSRIHLFW